MFAIFSWNGAVICNSEVDIATYTIRAAVDTRTLNKYVCFNLPKNIYSFNDLVALWEKKIGKNLEKIYIPEQLFLDQIKGVNKNAV